MVGNIIFCSKTLPLDLYRVRIENDQELQPFFTNLLLSLNCVWQKVPQYQCKCSESFWMFRPNMMVINREKHEEIPNNKLKELMTTRHANDQIWKII